MYFEKFQMNKFKVSSIFFILLISTFPYRQAMVFASEENWAESDVTEIDIIGRSTDLLKTSESASQGYVGRNEIEKRPILRAGEVFEVIPGMISTQHSGSGKANQYFLRGFNLDHGTDFSVFVDGVPANLPTHGHGQGYLDINFVIPELIDHVEYKKGVSYAEVGDFSSAGSAHISLRNDLGGGFFKLGIGEDQFMRGVAAQSFSVNRGVLLYGIETQYYNGPWVNDENFRKFNGLLKYTRGTSSQGWDLSVSGYRGTWDSTDQIPTRAVDSGLMNRLDAIDPFSGGETTRFIASGKMWWDNSEQQTDMTLYGYYYDLNLWSNFTYFLDDPINGDQFEQVDKRTVVGGTLNHTWKHNDVREGSNTSIGLDVRHDSIPEVALHKTRQRKRLSLIREDDVLQTSAGAYIKNESRWTQKFRSSLALRGDQYYFDVDSNLSQNSGTTDDAILSPKLGFVFGPWARTEYYVNGGLGFHSNDGRGTTTTVDPDSGSAVNPVDGLVRSKGAEAGLRTSFVPRVHSTLVFWQLDLDSELLFVGDAGTTEASRPSRRRGVEFANFYQVFTWLDLDLDINLTNAEFTDSDPAGNHIPGAIEQVISAGATMDFLNGIFGSFRVRHFGERPLVEDNRVRSDPTTVCNAQIGYRAANDWFIHVDGLNVFNSKDHDIDYFYRSRLTGEPSGGVDDIHFHPIEPRTIRVYVSKKFN